MKPVPPGPVGEFAHHLRRGRLRSGLERSEVAHAIACSLATVQRAEAGERLPPLPTARAYATACGMDPDETEALWNTARRATRPGRQAHVPDLGTVADAADLGAVLADAHERAGAPPYRELERRAKRRARVFGPMSRSTFAGILNRERLPATEERLLAFLAACRVPDHTFPLWVSAYRRVRRSERLAARRLNTVRTAEASGSSEAPWVQEARLEYERSRKGVRSE